MMKTELADISEEKEWRIKQNMRVVSPYKRLSANHLKLIKPDVSNLTHRDRKLHWSADDYTESDFSPNNSFGLSRSGTFFDMDKKMSTTEPQKNSHHDFLRRMSSHHLTKSYTMPELFDSTQLKNIYEENEIRKSFRDNIAKDRLHTTQNVGTSRSQNKVINKFPPMLVKEKYIQEYQQKVTENEKKLVADTRRKSIEESGLWQLASASVFNYKAQKTHNLDDFTMAMFTRKVAINKMRQKIEKKLDLPSDHFSRIATLRSNVAHIERRFKNIAQGASTEASNATSIHALQRFADDANYVHEPKFMKPGEAKRFFRRYARIVLIILKWIELIMDSSEQNKLERELKSFVDIANEVSSDHVSKAMDEYGLSFDKNYFVARKEISLTQDHKKTLTTRWNFRTPEMIKQVMHGLQTLRSLSEYPLVTQEKLCKVAWYQTLGSKKAIVRQGHNAESFYFILAGTDPKSGETSLNTVARLTRGQSFGEIGLIFNTKRTATVESATPMELLVIGKDDFNSIFMNDNNDEEAEHVKFLRQVPIMQHWPIESLRDEPGTCILHYFKRGALVSDDGKNSEWLYFIKSGSCEVLKKLRNVKARKSGQIKRKPDPMAEIVLPVLGGGPEAKIDTGQPRKRHKIYMNTDVFQDMANYYESLRRKIVEEAHKKKDDDESKLHLPKLPGTNLVTIPEFEEPESESNSETSVEKLPRITNGAIPEETIYIPPVMRHIAGYHLASSQSKFNPKNPFYQSHFIMPTSAMLKSEEPPPKCAVFEEEEDHTKNTKVFVKLELLQTKDVFGLNTLTGWGSEDLDDILKDSPTTCLVSKGAEIVMLSKKVFLKYINDNVRNNLRESIRAYPREQKMQENFQTKLDWDDYKNSLLTNVMHTLVDTHPTATL